MNNSSSRRDCLTDIAAWWRRVGLFTKTITYVCVGIWFSKFITPVFYDYGINMAYYTFTKLQLWRPLTAGLIHSRLIDLLFVFWALLSGLADYERDRGTLRATIDFFVNNFAIHMMCNVFFVLLAENWYYYMLYPTFGLWSYVLFCITLRCCKNPDGTSRFCFMPFNISNRYYVPILIAIFSAMRESICFEYIMAYCYGLAHFRYLEKHYDSIFSITRISGWEERPCFRGLESSGFITVSDATGIHVSQPNNPMQSSADPQPYNAPQVSIRPFAGKGIVLGGSNIEAVMQQQQMQQPQPEQPQPSLSDQINARPKKGYNHLEEQNDSGSSMNNTESNLLDTDIESQKSYSNQ